MLVAKSLLRFFAGLLAVFAITGCSKKIIVDQNARGPFRITGYLVKSDIVAGDVTDADFSFVSYINIAFINPDSTGNLNSNDSLKQFVEQAHGHHIRVLASIGGGSAPAYYSLLMGIALRSAVIGNLVALTDRLNLDGIDVDLEGERIDGNYQAFVTELAAALKQRNKLITAAVATVYGERYNDKALSCFDYINIMSYDKTGPWRPDVPGQHAPYGMAVDDINYWTTVRGISAQKLSLGLPFYGYGFGPGAPQDLSYNTIVAQYPGAALTDSIKTNGGGTIYYNGRLTIKAKTKLALQQLGGVMIWQLKQDTNGANSLKSAVNEIASGK